MMSESIIAYKIFKRDDDLLKSLCEDDIPESYVVIYNETDWNKPVILGSKLFCFKEFKEAKNEFEGLDPIFELWEVEVKVLEISFQRARLIGFDVLEQFNKFWNKKAKLMDITEPPKGTYFCDEVKLIERIS